MNLNCHNCKQKQRIDIMMFIHELKGFKLHVLEVVSYSVSPVNGEKDL